MIKLTIGTNTERKVVMVDVDDTLADVLSNNNVDASRSALHLNGTLIPGADKELTFRELGIEDGSEAMLISVIKADSAK
jgi:sulfur carrier protein ThiS